MSWLAPISNCVPSSEPHSSSSLGEHVGERGLGPCVRPTLVATNCEKRLRASNPRLRKSVQVWDLAETALPLAGGALCRLRWRASAPNIESGRERPRPAVLTTARLASKRGRSRPDLALNLPHDVGQSRTRIVPRPRAPFKQRVARHGRRLAWSFAS